VIRNVVCALAFVACAAPALAQNTVQFFPRFDFRLAADHLSSGDRRFVWDTNFGGDMDVVDYGLGRAIFVANYEAVLGEQFHSFDPNQGNYVLDFATSLRGHGLEVAALFHHSSRHLSDRFKLDPIAWNMLGVSVSRDVRPGSMQLRANGNVLGTLLKQNVDYNWEANGGVQVRMPVRPHISAISEGQVRLVGVDGAYGRGLQHGARGEAGLRFEGQGGAVELVVAAERRIDAHPIVGSAMSWFSAGFRFVSR
jgi:hypothetical protein